MIDFFSQCLFSMIAGIPPKWKKLLHDKTGLFRVQNKNGKTVRYFLQSGLN